MPAYALAMCQISKLSNLNPTVPHPFRHPPSAIRSPLSAISYPLSAMSYPLSAIRYQPSVILAEPQLQHEEEPEPVGVVLAARAVGGDKLLHHLRAEQVPAGGSLGEERVAKERL